MPIHDVLLVTKLEYPALFKAFELISHDCGRQAGHENYAIPLTWKSTIRAIEMNLANILMSADSDFECLCIGEEVEQQRIVIDYRIPLVDELLTEFFEEFS